MIDWIKRYKWWLFGIIIAGALVAWFERWLNLRDHRHDDVILAAAGKYGVDPALVKAVVWRESRFDASAKGRSGEIGLMQIMPATGEDWAAAERQNSFTPTQLFKPADNAQCGAWYLNRLLRRYRNTDNPLIYTLAAYNAGPTTVAKWTRGAGATNSAEFLMEMDYGGTKRYIKSVTQRYRDYQRQFAAAKKA